MVVRQAAESVPLGEEAQITLDTSAAGRGACTCHIRQPNGGEADLDIEDNADGTVSLFYTPRIPGTYSVEIKFGGVVIPQSPLQQRVRLMLPPTLLVYITSTFAAPLFTGCCEYSVRFVSARRVLCPIMFCLTIGENTSGPR